MSQHESRTRTTSSFGKRFFSKARRPQNRDLIDDPAGPLVRNNEGQPRTGQDGKDQGRLWVFVDDIKMSGKSKHAEDVGTTAK